MRARWLLSFLLASAMHGGLLFVLKGAFVQGPEFAVSAGDTSVEVSLLAAAPAVEEVVAAPPPEISETPPGEPVPEPLPPPPDVMVDPTPLPPSPSPPRTEPRKPARPLQKKPAPPRPEAVGEGNSAITGTDAATLRRGTIGDRSKPGYLRNPHPAYPEAARAAGQQGTVQLRVRVNSDGLVSSVALARSSGFPLLDERALSTVRDRWTFKPARIGGIAVTSEVIIPIRFTLDR